MKKRTLLIIVLAAWFAAAAGLIAYAYDHTRPPDRCEQAVEAARRMGSTRVPTTVTAPLGSAPFSPAARAANEANRQNAAAFMYQWEQFARLVAGNPSCFSPDAVAKAESWLAGRGR
jgi:hypothetical protein